MVEIDLGVFKTLINGLKNDCMTKQCLKGMKVDKRMKVIRVGSSSDEMNEALQKYCLDIFIQKCKKYKGSAQFDTYTT